MDDVPCKAVKIILLDLFFKSEFNPFFKQTSMNKLSIFVSIISINFSLKLKLILLKLTCSISFINKLSIGGTI